MLSNFRTISILFLLLFSFGNVSTVIAHGGGHAKEEDLSGNKVVYFSGLDSEAGKVVERFHAALKNGNEIELVKLLAKNIVVYEEGNVERTLEEYAANHMKTDIDFLKDVNVTTLELQVKEYGEIATSYSRNKAQGIYQGNFINQESMETLVLSKTSGEWKIVHIHWSN